MRRLAWLLLLCSFPLLAASRSASPEEVPGGEAAGADAVVARSIEAAGGLKALDAARSLSFRSGVAHYTVAGDGRMNVRLQLHEPAIFETLAVDEHRVHRNRLGRIEELSGVERDRWLALARLFSGCFTPRNFTGSLTGAGRKAYGPESFHVLEAMVGDLRAEIFVDCADYRVRRLLLTGRDEDGIHWQQCHEFGGAQASGGLTLPATMYEAQVGVGGTFSPYPRPIGEVQTGGEVNAKAFRDLSVNCGRSTAGPGWIEGVVLEAFFEEEPFVLIFTNWTEEEVRRAGWRDGDLLQLEAGGVEFASRFYFSEDRADPSHRIYDPGNSFFTRSPRYPMFYAQFNTCVPAERFAALRTAVRLLEPIRGRKK